MELLSFLPSPTAIDSLATNKAVSVKGFLSDQAAGRLHNCLSQEVPWGLAFRLDGKPVTRIATASLDELEPEERQKLRQQLSEPFQFIYNTYMMVTAYLEQRDPELLLHRVLEWLNSDEVLNYFRSLTGVAGIVKCNAQATRYLPGHFLKNHNDFNATEGRRFAYVLSLTKDWQADWGGLLQFTDADGNVARTIVPSFNALNVFEVPQDHSVSFVAPYAERPRLAITGWMLDR